MTPKTISIMSIISKEQFEAAYGREMSEGEFAIAREIFAEAQMPLDEFVADYRNHDLADSAIVTALRNQLGALHIEIASVEHTLFKTRESVAKTVAVTSCPGSDLRELAVELVGERSYLLAKLDSTSSLDSADRKVLATMLRSGDVDGLADNPFSTQF